MSSSLPPQRAWRGKPWVSLRGSWIAVSPSIYPLEAFVKHISIEVPVSRAADSAMDGTGLIWLSPDDPCLVLGEDTRFLTQFAPRMQILLPKSLNSLVAEVSEVISDTQLKIKREFGGESGKGTSRMREKFSELQQEGLKGLEYKRLPFVDQQKMYRYVYQCLKKGGSIGIFPEGVSCKSLC